MDKPTIEEDFPSHEPPLSPGIVASESMVYWLVVGARAVAPKSSAQSFQVRRRSQGMEVTTNGLFSGTFAENDVFLVTINNLHIQLYK